MAEPALKVVTEEPAAKEQPPSKTGLSRGRLRGLLLIGVPLLVVIAGVSFYLAGGRYISTDNAYVGAQKVLITPDISGKIGRVLVREGQHVAPGDELFEIDAQPFRIAVTQADAKLASVRTDFANLKTNFQSLTKLTDLAQKNVEIKQRDVDRKTALVGSGAGSKVDVDTAVAALLTAQLQAQYTAQQKGDTLNQLLGQPDLPIDKYPPYLQASAVLEQAQRDLDHTVLRAPIGGTATQVDNIQLGRFVTAGTPVLSVIDDRAPWVDANPKETDITYLRIGQAVTVDVDSFPDHTFHGTVIAVSPGTGAQFSILPPQNASGNWVKVVQRVPVRIQIEPDDATAQLRAGMSATVDIDTKRGRSFAGLLGLSSAAKEVQ